MAEWDAENQCCTVSCNHITRLKNILNALELSALKPPNALSGKTLPSEKKKTVNIMERGFMYAD